MAYTFDKANTSWTVSLPPPLLALLKWVEKPNSMA